MGRLDVAVGVDEASAGPDGVGGRCKRRGENSKNVVKPQSPVHDKLVAAGAAVEYHHEIANAGVVQELGMTGDYRGC